MIQDVVSWRPSYGYRRVTSLVCRKLLLQGKSRVNAKRVQRIMRENGLLLQRHTGRPTKAHDGKIITLKSNLRWCSDGFRIQCWNGEHLEIAFSLDCCDREVMSWVSSTRGIDGQMIRDLMAETIESRFGAVSVLPHRIQWLTDNGPGYVANETVTFGRSLGLEVCTTAPYSPESNGMAEAFVKTFKRDYVAYGDLSSAMRVLEQLPGWFEDYNECAPHKGLAMRSPREYLKIHQHA
jgi:transposase InsO family protein